MTWFFWNVTQYSLVYVVRVLKMEALCGLHIAGIYLTTGSPFQEDGNLISSGVTNVQYTVTNNNVISYWQMVSAVYQPSSYQRVAQQLYKKLYTMFYTNKSQKIPLAIKKLGRYVNLYVTHKHYKYPL